uniref:Uncharacterized protein n=1 Tax=Anguilla anguilla TaxID=7936 RepID=A0A0E9QNK7_ANGAN
MNFESPLRTFTTNDIFEGVKDWLLQCVGDTL